MLLLLLRLLLAMNNIILAAVVAVEAKIKCAHLSNHARRLVEKMSWVVFYYRGAPEGRTHRECDPQALLVRWEDTECFSSRLAYLSSEVLVAREHGSSILAERAAVVKSGMVGFPIEVDVDVCGDRVNLLTAWQPSCSFTRDANIVNTRASSMEWAGNIMDHRSWIMDREFR